MTDLAARIEHTLLRPHASEGDHRRLCEEAARHRFAGVCVLPGRIALCRDLLVGAESRVVTVVGFPLGSALPGAKAWEASAAVAAGADEVDMVWDLGAFKDGRIEAVVHEIKAVVEACEGRPLKVIVETALLDRDEKQRAAELVAESGAAYIKTSTGFAAGGASEADVSLFRAVAGERLSIKASGGIRTHAQALALVAAGADRLGASAGVALLAPGAGLSQGPG